MYSKFLQPFINDPTRVLGKNRPTLIDNIFVHTFDKQLFAGNLLDNVSDDLSSFLIINGANKFSFKKKNSRK